MLSYAAQVNDCFYLLCYWDLVVYFGYYYIRSYIIFAAEIEDLCMSTLLETGFHI